MTVLNITFWKARHNSVHYKKRKYNFLTNAKRDEKKERGFGRGGDRGGRGGRKDQRRGPKNEVDEWQPVTKLGRLVKF